MPSPLEQLLSQDDLRDVGMDQLKKRMLMQMLLQNPVAEGDVDPTAPHYTGPGRSVISPHGGILPDRSGDTGMALKPSGNPLLMAPRDQGLSVGLISSKRPQPKQTRRRVLRRRPGSEFDDTPTLEQGHRTYDQQEMEQNAAERGPDAPLPPDVNTFDPEDLMQYRNSPKPDEWVTLLRRLGIG